jgi:hypothetical protein
MFAGDAKSALRKLGSGDTSIVADLRLDAAPLFAASSERYWSSFPGKSACMRLYPILGYLQQ